ncbi:PAS domain S-box protein [Thalassovita aquimarina]|uniref:histidine kinase n=1 Tax=Thalassovita aquimarina TaxID=2785917 RepID=A0ABS5HPL9_9RHOB|nr:PAS domain S-box protein [Thalassovita aquimarina]MBR9650797.1 PAS domain S-box protein [Thalassovita aquimarina]
MTDAQFRRGLFIITALALVLPPGIGFVVLAFVGFYPFPEILQVFLSWNALYAALCMVAAFWSIGRYAEFVISSANSTFSERALWYLKITPWILFVILAFYFIGGVLTAHASMQALGHGDYSMAQHAFGLFAAIPALMITALPLFFMLTDHLGRYLAPRGVPAVVAPMWLRLTVLGLFTPVMIGTLLITYYYDRTGVFTDDTLAVWLILIAAAGAGTFLAWRSFRRSLESVKNFLNATGGAQAPPEDKFLPVPASLDEIGEVISRWRERVVRNRKAETELRENTARLVNAQRIAKIGDFSWDIRTNAVQRSENVYRIWGRTPEQFASSKEAFLDTVHPDDRAVVSDVLRGASEGRPYSIDYRITLPSGELRYIHEETELAYDAAGRPATLWGTVQDITQRRVVENEVRQLNETLESRVARRTQELEKAKRRAEEYLNIAGAIIVALGRRGEITLINDSGCRLIGYEREELIGKDWFDTCLPPEDRDEVRKVFSAIVEGNGGGLSQYTNAVMTKDGSRRMVAWHNSLIEEDGCIQGCLSSGEDVTERLKTEQALRRSEREARLVSDSLPVGLTYNSKDLQYRRVNPTYAKWFGKTPEEIRGAFVKDIIDEQGLPFIYDRIRTVLTGQTVEFERTVPVSNGTVELSTTMVPYIRENGEIDGFFSIVTDITERKRTEAQFRNVQKMEALGNLAGGVAHNLNNLLVPIVGLSGVSADDLPEGSEQREVMERIHRASERARDIVARILAFSRQDKPAFETFELKGLIRDALALASSSLQSNIALSVDMTDRDTVVDADKVQIETLFLNIFNNAAAAIGAVEGGKIEVSLRREDLGPRRRELIDPQLRTGSYATLVVQDNGPGMDDHVKAHIFDPFFTTKKVGEGTGLGLSMAHGIIREHEGAITVDSEPGQGTRFSIYLPLPDPRNTPVEME